MRWLQWVIGLVWLWPSWVFGAVVPDVFKSTQWVVDYSPEAREQAVAAGMREVLVRYSGRTEVLAAVGGGPLLKTPEAYLASFNYQTLSVPRVDERGDVLKYEIVIEFNGQPIQDQLVAAGLPIWPNHRPEIAVWWVVDRRNERQVLARATENPLADAIRAVQGRRGLNLVLPEMDAEDQQRASASVVWSLDYDRLEAASARYRAAAILVVRASETLSGSWYAQWGTLVDGKLDTFYGDFDSVQMMAERVLNPLAERLAQIYAVVIQPDSQVLEPVQLRVYPVQDLYEYAEVSRYLEQLILVRSVRVAEVLPSYVVFEVRLQGRLEQFKQALALDNQLQPDVSAFSANEGGDLNYRWMPEDVR